MTGPLRGQVRNSDRWNKPHHDVARGIDDALRFEPVIGGRIPTVSEIRLSIQTNLVFFLWMMSWRPGALTAAGYVTLNLAN